MSARDWQAYLTRMHEEPPWKRAWRYRLMMSHQGFRSIPACRCAAAGRRALAWAIRADHSRVAQVLQILKLPEPALAALRTHAGLPLPAPRSLGQTAARQAGASGPTSPKSASGNW